MAPVKVAPVKVAMIGLGWWGKKMTAVLKAASKDIEIVCAAEPNPAGKEFATANGFAWYASDQEALKHPGVEAVILATPHSLHAAQIKRAAAAKKHIFCEKPLALTKKGAELAGLDGGAVEGVLFLLQVSEESCANGGRHAGENLVGFEHLERRGA